MGAAEVAALWRHPVKGFGSETLDEIALTEGQPMPFDRVWALLHKGAEDRDGWQKRKNFLVVVYGPKLAQITARTGADGAVTLSHPDRGEVTVRGPEDGAALIDWADPIWPEENHRPHRLVAAPPTAMADHEPPQVSILSLASLRTLSQRAGAALDPRRFRGNIWLDGLAPWEEFDLVGRTIRIGGIAFEITERIERCRATEANPETGYRDVNIQKLMLDAYDHKDFGVLATVRGTGTLRVGDAVELG